ncbi:MAG TPA: hypothetical protein VH092_23960 [Urbifossiella sp.]|nr:hypothetical protein [Urbifossiella sp.]
MTRLLAHRRRSGFRATFKSGNHPLTPGRVAADSDLEGQDRAELNRRGFGVQERDHALELVVGEATLESLVR